jgi:hypothetical protein
MDTTSAAARFRRQRARRRTSARIGAHVGARRRASARIGAHRRASALTNKKCAILSA